MNAYFERSILDAEPVELTRIVFQRALDSVREARRHLAAGAIEDRVRSISRAYAALDELQSSLRHEEAPDLVSRMGSLYDYIQAQLIEANFTQSDYPLALAQSLLTTLSEGWTGVLQQLKVPDEESVAAPARLAMTA